jgi:hypothetical protein
VSDGSPEQPRELTDAERRRRRARVFGDVLPDRTRDERGDDGAPARGARGADGTGDASEEWLRRQVPPHHGG